MSPEIKSELHYLASPYTHFEGGLENAFQEAAELAGRLLLAGVHCFSPIVHGHPLSQYGGVEAINHILWLEHDEKHMARCDALLVATFKGWEDSYGVTYEIDWFKRADRPVRFIDPESLEVTA